MADRVVGYAGQPTKSGNTFTFTNLDREIAAEFGVGAYLFNITQNDALEITDTNAGDSPGRGVAIWYTVSGDASAWVSGVDRVSPAADNGKVQHNTQALAFAAASTGDRLLYWYDNTSNNPWWYAPLNSGITTKGVSAYGMLPDRGIHVHLINQTYFYRLSGDLSGIAAQLDIKNLSFHTYTSSIFFYWNDTTGGGAGIHVDRCVTYGGQYSMRVTAGDANVCHFDRCISIGTSYGMRHSRPVLGYNCICLGGDRGFDMGNVASTLTNCLAWGNNNGFTTLATVTIDYCASGDASAAGGNSLTNQTAADLDLFVRDFAYGYSRPAIVIGAASALLGAGTAVGSITKDVNGVAWSEANPNIGCGGLEPDLAWSAAADIRDGNTDSKNYTGTITGVLDLPSVGAVRLAVTFDDGNQTGTDVAPAEADVRDGTGYGAGGTEFEGSLDTVVPTTPTLVMADDEDGDSATATITGADAGTTNRVYWAPRGSSDWTLGGVRSGNGTVEIAPPTGLGHYWAHCVSDNGSFTATAPVAFPITSGEDSIAWQIAEAVESALVAEAYVTEGSVAYTVSVDMPPRAETVTTPELIVYLNTDMPDPMATNQDDMNYRVGIVISRRTETEAAVKNAINLRREIQKLFLTKRLTWYADAYCSNVADGDVTNLAYLDENKAVVMAIELTFRVSENTA